MARKILGYVQLIWRCDSCGTKNPGAIKTCTACGAPQAIDVKFEQVDAESFNFIKDEALIRMAQSGPDKHCPYCGTRNLANALACLQCTGDLTVGAKSRPSGMAVGEDAQPVEVEPNTYTPVSAYQPSMPPMSRNLLLVLMLVFLIICGYFAWNTIRANRTINKSATVVSSNWERNIAIEAYTTVSDSDWRSDIPYNATVSSCYSRHRYDSSTYVSGSVESCGEPYTVDTGTGIGQVVQDCVYEVYEDYCDYEIMDWVHVDTLTATGTNTNVAWPDVNLMQNQRVGGRSESYTIYFNADGKTYTLRTSDFDIYQQALPGSLWDLAVSVRGDVRRAEPQD